MLPACHNCKNELAPDASFCRHCGERVLAAPVEETVESVEERFDGAIECSSCCVKNSLTARFCKSCGQALYTEQNPVDGGASASGGRENPRRFRALMISVAGLALAGAVGVGAYQWLKADNQSEKPKTNNAPSAISAQSGAGTAQYKSFTGGEYLQSSEDGANVYLGYVTKGAADLQLEGEMRALCSAKEPGRRCVLLLLDKPYEDPSKHSRRGLAESLVNDIDQPVNDGFLDGAMVAALSMGDGKDGNDTKFFLNCNIIPITTPRNGAVCVSDLLAREPAQSSQSLNAGSYHGTMSDQNIIVEITSPNFGTASYSNIKTGQACYTSLEKIESGTNSTIFKQSMRVDMAPCPSLLRVSIVKRNEQEIEAAWTDERGKTLMSGSLSRQ